jgi:rod shape determining protein RodA
MTSLADALAPLARTGDRAAAGDRRASRTDWVLVGCALALCGLGALLVWSATRQGGDVRGTSSRAYLERDLVNIALGSALGTVVALAGRDRIRRFAPGVYLLSLVGLVLVLTPLGATVNGSHSWISLPGGLEVQPAEFAKVALVVGTALVLGEWRPTPDGPGSVEVVVVLLLAALPIGLVLLQPDLGTVMVLGSVVLALLAVSGAPKRWLVVLLLGGVLGAAAVGHLHLLKDYQVKRFTAFVHPEADPRGFGYNAVQARLTVGSGGVFGTGLFHGPQTNGRFVPEQHTDFIFTVAGEELGFAGCSILLLMLGVVLWRGLRIAARAPDPFGALVAAGVVCWFAFQVFENVGMSIGIMPITGLPLPFLSYGGSAMFANLAGVGLLVAVGRTPSR